MVAPYMMRPSRDIVSSDGFLYHGCRRCHRSARCVPSRAMIFRQCTGRQELPREPFFREGWLIYGGKSLVLVVAVFLACFRDYRSQLAPGERGTVLIIATDRRQARTIL